MTPPTPEEFRTARRLVEGTTASAYAVALALRETREAATRAERDACVQRLVEAGYHETSDAVKRLRHRQRSGE